MDTKNIVPTDAGLDNFAIGNTVIIRTYSSGVWFGVLEKKCKNEVILKDARRMWRWWCRESISLSGVVCYGINQKKSKIAPPEVVETLARPDFDKKTGHFALLPAIACD